MVAVRSMSYVELRESNRNKLKNRRKKVYERYQNAWFYFRNIHAQRTTKSATLSGEKLNIQPTHIMHRKSQH